MKKITTQMLCISLILSMLPGCNQNPTESSSTEITSTTTEEVSSEASAETTEEVTSEEVADINAIVEDYDWEYSDWTFTEAKGTELIFDEAERFRHVQYFNGMTYINNHEWASPDVYGFLMEGTHLDLGRDDYDMQVEIGIDNFWCYDNMIAIFAPGPTSLSPLSLLNIEEYWETQNLSMDCDQVFFKDGKLIAKISPEDNDDYIEIFDAYTGESLRKVDFPDFTNDHILYLCEDFAIVEPWNGFIAGIFHFDTLKFEKIDYYFNLENVEKLTISSRPWVFNGNVYYVDNGNFVELYEQGEKVSRLLIKDFDKMCAHFWDMDKNLILYENFDNDMVVYDLFTGEEKKICGKPDYVLDNKSLDENSYFYKDAWLSEGHVIVKEPREKKYDFDRNYLGIIYEYDLEGNKTFVTDKISASDDFHTIED